MGKTTGGEKKVLGVNCVCSDIAPGTFQQCEVLVKRKDGLYGCKKCGMVFEKPELDRKYNQKILKRCSCKTLISKTRWVHNEFYGHECPERFYICEKCKRVHKGAYDCAPISKQKTAIAKKRVEFTIEMKNKDVLETKKRIREMQKGLKEQKAEQKRLERKIEKLQK